MEQKPVKREKLNIKPSSDSQGKRNIKQAPKKKSSSYSANKKAFEKCAKLWPRIFNISEPRPLSLRIRDVLIEDAENKGYEVSRTELFCALFWMTKTHQYLTAIVNGRYRYDLSNQVAGMVTADQKTQAKEALYKIPRHIRTPKKKVFKNNRNGNPAGNRNGNGNGNGNGNKHTNIASQKPRFNKRPSQTPSAAS
ncbi:hypothetical protein QTV43_000457 [Vibrio vulnificus]|nr:hypothetical protein [Vibrio vulnificus]